MGVSFEKGTPGNTVATFPSRRFLFVLDPLCLPLFIEGKLWGLLDLIADLARIECPIRIEILLPEYLLETLPQLSVDQAKRFIRVTATPEIPRFVVDSSVPQIIREKFHAETPDAVRPLSLLALADALQADGIITGSELLIDGRYPILQHHRIRIVPANEFPGVVEVIAHGHSTFWSSENPERRHLTFDVFYQTTHWKARRLYEWFNSIQSKTGDTNLERNLHSLLINRYPFLLYTRDMIRFHELQRDYFSRRGLMMRFGMAVGYYVTIFYLLLWGLLDHLTLIAKYARKLVIDERRCGIRSAEFWDEFGGVEPGLKAFVEQKETAEWIEIMADMRHAAAHKTIAIPTAVLVETPESRKTDDEIREIVRKERAISYAVLPKEVMEGMEPMLISLWRIRHMKPVSESMVYLESTRGAYLRDPVVSLDYDLERATAIMDAFLVKLMGRQQGDA